MAEPDMANSQTEEPTRQKSLRLWPGVVAVVLLWLVRLGLKMVVPGFEGFDFGMMGGLLCALAIFLWWAFFSRAPHLERWGAIVLMIVAMFATWHIKHESMGPFWVAAYAVPVLCLTLVVWAVASRRLSDGPRRVTLVATILLACGVWTLVRTSGVDGDHVMEFMWRWAESPEERLLAQAGDESVALLAAPPAIPTGADWPGFRGPNRDGIIPGVRIETDWSASPPIELWRRTIGPGWSSFAVRGDLLYTQEQRGHDEVVSCYNVTTGELVWRHHDTARFFQSYSGAGPRGTPTLNGGRVYTLGATGILNALGADDGAIVWSRNVASDTDTKVPTSGFSSSPLVVDDVVIVAAASSLIAYDLTTGDLRWFSTVGSRCYSSPHLLRIDGVTQIMLMNETGATSVTPADGTLLWEHTWPGSPKVQPALTVHGDLLITANEGSGVRRIAVQHESGEWTIEERWTSTKLRPYFNNFVVHEGHVYGFSGRILTCIDVDDGKSKWKGGRYGGQLLLLADQDLLLILSEKGKLALVKATPDQFIELVRIPAIEGKTWNHPVLVGDVLLIRNGQEMVAFRLSLTDAR